MLTEAAFTSAILLALLTMPEYILEPQNVVEFSSDKKKGTLAAMLTVGVEYSTEEAERRVDFKFRTTDILAGQSAKKLMQGKNYVRDGWFDTNIHLPFAVGTGFFRVAWLDHALRIDRDTSNGKDWLNVYVYAGPASKCTAV